MRFQIEIETDKTKKKETLDLVGRYLSVVMTILSMKTRYFTYMNMIRCSYFETGDVTVLI